MRLINRERYDAALYTPGYAVEYHRRAPEYLGLCQSEVALDTYRSGRNQGMPMLADVYQ